MFFVINDRTVANDSKSFSHKSYNAVKNIILRALINDLFLLLVTVLLRKSTFVIIANWYVSFF